MSNCILRPLCCLLLVAGASAQVDRYELGLRLRAFERHIDAVTSVELRVAAFADLNRAVQAFFRLDTSAVATAIDAADAALGAEPLSVDQRHVQSLQLALAQRLLTVGEGEVAADLSQAYRIDDEEQSFEGCSLVLRAPGWAQPLIIPISELPQSIALPLKDVPAGDHLLQWQVVKSDEVLTSREQGLSVAADLDARLARLGAAVKQAEALEPATIESKTLPALVGMLQGMQRRRPAETILPGWQILAEAEALADYLAKPSELPFYGAHRPGSFRLRIPVAGSTMAVRLFVPKVSAPAPLVMALHGMGGSENLFFDGYGDGRVVVLGAKRDWLVVAPRLTFGNLDCAALVDAVAARFPVDRQRVAVVGHSMGAMQAVANAIRNPDRYRAVAALGGGGRVRRTAGLAQLPFFVGVGTKDFALAQANALHRALLAADAPSRLHEYADVEHLAIVQVALADVFRFFDEALAAADK